MVGNLSSALLQQFHDAVAWPKLQTLAMVRRQRQFSDHTTVETVRFERPAHVRFRLVRGPVPHVTETFTLTDTSGRTNFLYEGELGTDFGAVGQWWGKKVASKWVATVEASLAGISAEAERRASLHRG